MNALFLLVFSLVSPIAEAGTATQTLDPRSVRLAQRSYRITAAECLANLPSHTTAVSVPVWTCFVRLDATIGTVAYAANASNPIKRFFPTRILRGNITMYAVASGAMLELTSQESVGVKYRTFTREEAVAEIDRAFTYYGLQNVDLPVTVFVAQ